jgi:hypothetical protein
MAGVCRQQRLLVSDRLSAVAWVGDLPAALGEAVYTEGGANVGCRLSLEVFDLNTRCVRYAVYGVESRDNGAGVDQRGITHGRKDLGLRVREALIVNIQHGLRECYQQCPVRNVAISRLAEHQAQIEVFTLGFAALTEQVCM